MKHIRCTNFNDRHGQWSTDNYYIIYRPAFKHLYIAEWTTEAFILIKNLDNKNENYHYPLIHNDAVAIYISVFEMTEDEVLINLIAEEI